MKKFLKRVGIIFLVLIVLTGVMALYGTFGLKRTLNLTIHPVDLSQISDGTYTGSYILFWGILFYFSSRGVQNSS